MSEQTEQKVQNAMRGYLQPILLLIITGLVSGIGFFARDAYENMLRNQNEQLVMLNEVKENLTRYDERLKTVEKYKDEHHAEHKELTQEVNNIKIQIAGSRKYFTGSDKESVKD